MKSLLLVGALALSTNALSQAVQTQTLPAPAPQLSAVSPVLEVQRLAPQLIAFAGGDANFQNLVNGLASGTQVTLISGTQVVTFTPAGKLASLQIAQTLESVRQSLITRGIATPTAQQLAIALTGGALPTALGPTQVNGVIATTTAIGTNTVAQQSPAVSVQGSFGAPAAGSAAAGGTAGIRSNTSDSAFPRGISDTPPTAVPGVTTGTSTTPAPATATPGAASVRTQ
jgi:hypothetical protein